MIKTVIVNTNIRVRLDDDADIQDVIENATVSFQDTTGKAEIDEAHILNYEEVD